MDTKVLIICFFFFFILSHKISFLHRTYMVLSFPVFYILSKKWYPYIFIFYENFFDNTPYSYEFFSVTPLHPINFQPYLTSYRKKFSDLLTSYRKKFSDIITSYEKNFQSYLTSYQNFSEIHLHRMEKILMNIITIYQFSVIPPIHLSNFFQWYRYTLTFYRKNF